MKKRVLDLLSTPTDDPENPTPLEFDEICAKLEATNSERFKVGQAIIDLVKEEKIVVLPFESGNLYGVQV